MPVACTHHRQQSNALPRRPQPPLSQPAAELPTTLLLFLPSPPPFPRAAIYMLIAGPFLLPRGAGVKGAKKLFRRLRRRGADDGEHASCTTRAQAC